MFIRSVPRHRVCLPFRFRNNPNFLWVYARENYKLGFHTHSKAHDHRAKMHYKDDTRTPAYKNKMKTKGL